MDLFDSTTIIDEDITLVAVWEEEFMTISEVLSASNNTDIKFIGVVTGFTAFDNAKTKYEKVWLEDESGSITVYRPALATNTLSIGDKLIVRGKRAVYASLNQIGAGATFELVSKGNELKEATDITNANELVATLQGSRGNVSGTVLSVDANGQELKILVGATELLVRSNSTSSANSINIKLLDALKGQTVNLTDIHLDWYNGPQLLPTLLN